MNSDIYTLYQSNTSSLKFETMYTIEKNSTFQVYISSYGFSGSYCFCLHHEKIQSIMEALKDMQNNNIVSCTIQDADSESYLTLQTEQRQYKVTGQLGNFLDSNNLHFEFEVDQTIIPLLISYFRTLIRQ